MTKIKTGENKKNLIIVAVHNSRNWKEIEEPIEKIVEEERVNHIIIGEDFNARIGEEGGGEEDEWEVGRNSKDKK